MSDGRRRLNDLLGAPPDSGSTRVLVSTRIFRGFELFRGESIPLDGRTYIFYGYTIFPCGIRVASDFEIDTKCPTLLPKTARLWHIDGTWYMSFHADALAVLGISPENARPFSWVPNVPIQTVEQPPYLEGQILHSRVPMDQTTHGEGADDWKRSWDSRGTTDAYRSQRQQALTINRSKVGIRQPPPEMPVWGALMEAHSAYGILTLLVCLSDGTTSVYFGQDPISLGGREQQGVQHPAGQFIELANRLVSLMAPGDTTHEPARGTAIFYARTDTATLRSEAISLELLGADHPLAPLYSAGNAVAQKMKDAYVRKMPWVVAPVKPQTT